MFLLLIIIASAQISDEKRAQIVPEILDSAAQNGSLVKFSTDSVQGIAGVNRSVVPADGRSLAWGVIRLSDNQEQPIAYETVAIATSEGKLYVVDDIPQTDSAGTLIFAIQSVEGRTTTATVRFYFPRLQLGGQIDIFFCTDCFTPADDCVGISSAVSYERTINVNRVCSTNEFAGAFALGARAETFVWFESVTFHAPSRPADAFPEIVASMYSNCCGWGCNPESCRMHCNDGFPYYQEAATIGDTDAYSLPNDEISAEIEYLVYTSSGGTTCRRSFTYTARHPSLVLESHPENLYAFYHYGHLYGDSQPTPARFYVSIQSPLLQAGRGQYWYNSIFLLEVIINGLEDQWREIQRIPIEVPTRQPVEVVIPVSDRNFGSAWAVDVRLLKHRWDYGFLEVDSIRGYLNINVNSIYALGRNSATRTFDFEVTYTLSLSRQLITQRGASSGVIIVRDPANQEIYRYIVPREKLSLGQHTVVVKIPEDQMTRFGRYVFVPHFVDDLAGYYRDRQPRLAQVRGRLFFDTPGTYMGEPSVVGARSYYTIVNAPNNLAYQSFPTENETCFLIAVIPVSYDYYYLYEPIPPELNNRLFVGKDYWRGDGGAQRPDPTNDYLDDFFGRKRYYFTIPSFHNNRQAEQIGTSLRLWPGPKLEFRWLKLRHAVFDKDSSNRRLYYWQYEDTGAEGSTYMWRARVGTHYFAVATSTPALDFYLVEGPRLGDYRGRISKQQFNQLLRSGKLISRDASSGFNAPLRISAKGRFPNVVTQDYKRRVIEWASTFVNVRYEWGGCWFGGRAHPNQRDSSGDAGYEGFGIDCSKLISVAAMMAGLRWDRQYQNIRWWDIGAFHLASDVYPYTRGWPDKRTARLNAQPGDILVKPGYGRDHPGHVALLAELTVRDYIDPITRQPDRLIWARIIDASGPYDGVTINDGRHLIPRRARRVRGSSREDTVGILMEEADGVGRTYRLRQLRRIPPN
jgi:cell wall-associated NlpC family hydrolase